MPHSRELLSQETPQEYLSVGGAFSELQCGAVTQDPLRAPFAGESYETVYPATHYLLTAGSTALVHATVPVISWFQSARLASGVWLPALALLVVALVGTLGGPAWAAFAAGLVVRCTPLILTQGVISCVAAVGIAVKPAVVAAVVIIAMLEWQKQASARGKSPRPQQRSPDRPASGQRRWHPTLLQLSGRSASELVSGCPEQTLRRR